MTQTKINVPEGFMLNARGGLDPVAIVKDVDKLRDDMVHEIVNESIQKHKELQEMKKRFFSTIDAFVRLSAEKYNLNYGGKKGNMTFLSYDGMYKVVVSVNENIFFDERLQIAKELIDQCIQDWATDSRNEIKALIQDAFYVGKSGKLDKNRILGLRRLDIQDDRWQKAMTAISDSIQIAGSREYIRIYERDPNNSDKYNLINLDIAALDCE
ncbi:MAG: DUF3164 family protein [Treponema sp.]|nr:DUF3164 family protein [Treponema sp.]